MLKGFVIFAYVCSAWAYGLRFVGKKSQVDSRFRLLAFMALIGHGWLLYRWVEISGGQNMDPFLMLSLTVWLMGLIVFLTFNEALSQLNLMIYPLAMLSVVIYQITHGYEVVHTQQSQGVLFHILISFMAISVLLLTPIQAFVVSVQNRCLRRQVDHALLSALPPLQHMEKLLFYILGAGFVLLTLSLLSATLFLGELFTNVNMPKILLATGAWALFLMILVGRWLFGLRGRGATFLILLAGILLFSSYFGTKWLNP